MLNTRIQFQDMIAQSPSDLHPSNDSNYCMILAFQTNGM